MIFLKKIQKIFLQSAHSIVIAEVAMQRLD